MASPRNRRAKPAQLAGPKRALIYVRISVDREGYTEAGLARQEEACRALCLARGWQVIDVLDDTISATKHRLAEREGWKKVRSRVDLGEVDVIVAWHLDRVTRSMKDLEELIDLAVERGVGMATATGDIDLTTDTGRMVARILAAVAAAEGERKAERIVLAFEQRAAMGTPLWTRRPFGYERSGELREKEADLVRDAYDAVLRGKSLGGICRHWNEMGYRTTAPDGMGGPGDWSSDSLRRLLLNVRNAGTLERYGEAVGPGNWMPIVDQVTYRAVKRFLMDPSRRTGNDWKVAHLLSGIAVCDNCKAVVRARRDKQDQADEAVYLYQSRCGHVTLNAEWVEGVVLRRLVARAQRDGRVSWSPEPAREAFDTEPLERRKREIGVLLEELGEDRAAGLITRESMLAASAKLTAELAEIEAQLDTASLGNRWDYVDIEHLYEEFEAMDLDEQRALIRDSFTYIGIKAPGRGTRRSKPLPQELIVTLPE